MLRNGKISGTGLIALCLLLGFSGRSQALLTSYASEAAFNAANSAALVLEGFEALAPGETSIVTPGFTLTTSATSAPGAINQVYTGVYATEGTNYFGWYINTGDSLMFNFNAPQTVFSMDITDLASISLGNNIDVFADGSQIPDIAGLSYPYVGSSGALDFLGLISDTPFNSLEFTFKYGEWIGIDRIQYDGVPGVPVPAALWLFATALAGLAGIARRRTNNAG